ncbi:MAG: endonuclease III [Candidatus Margulisbacteria bacterium]|nr:endonuclease III [Candidatus Margulisiibacteriota bacterium]
MTISIKDLAKILPVIEKLNKSGTDLYISDELGKLKNTDEKALKVLLAAIISLRTREKTTWEVSLRLFGRLDNLKDLNKISLAELRKLLYPCGFYRRKATQMKQLAAILNERYSGRVPDDLDELLTLPGVGRKVANLVLIEAFDKDGICVDTHVHRIFNRWKLVKTKTPEQTEMELRKILPKIYWKTINKILVKFGQNTCLPIKPKCSTCFLLKKCPYGNGLVLS